MTSEMSSGQTKCWTSGSRSNLLTESSLYSNSFITSVGEVPGLILSGILVDKIGRRFRLLLMYLLGFAFLLPLMFHQHKILTMLLPFGACMCVIGTYTVAGIYCPELYPTSVRTMGLEVGTAAGRIACKMICPLVAIGLVSDCHQMAAVSLLELVTFVSAVTVMLFQVETRPGKGAG